VVEASTPPACSPVEEEDKRKSEIEGVRWSFWWAWAREERRRWPGGEREEGWAERGESPRGLFYFQNPFLSFENNFVK
jgi:hypothetical protein